MKHLVLVGFMGSGKTAVGRKIAARLGLPFVDTDARVEELAGRPIRILFEEHGEDAFRDLEARIVADAAAGPPSIVSTGGGALLRAENLDALKRTGVLIHLDVDPRTVLRRTGNRRDRPLLAGEGDPLARIEELMDARRPIYAQAHGRVAATRGTVGATATAAIREWRRLGGDGRAAGDPEISTVHVDLGERSYPVRIGAGTIDRIGEWTAGVVAGRHAFVVTHPAIQGFHGDSVRASLEAAGFRVTVGLVPPGERQKSLPRLTDLCRRMLAAGIDRGSILVALGGGVVGDLGGLTAALYMRGIPYVQVPTTLLAMVDSSVGGKTGVDLDDAKNSVGTFHQPSLVVADPDMLRTLPAREVRAGLAEVIKYGVLGDAGFFGWIAANARALTALEPEPLAAAIRRSCEIKADLVRRDEYDRLGARIVLNLGHTVGHALEAVGGYRTYRHGEAVAIGMVAAARLAERLGIAEEPISDPIVSVLRAVGLPASPKEAFPADALLDAMLKDKKTTAGVLNFVLPTRIGSVVVRPVASADVLAVVEALARSGRAGVGDRRSE